MIKYHFKQLLTFVLFMLLYFPLKAQEIDFDRLLESDVENINPVYKPIVGFGIGYMGYIGSVKNNIQNPLTGGMAGKLNFMTYIDAKRYFKLNIFVLATDPRKNQGLTVNQLSYNNPSKNLNFQASINTLGLNVLYDFNHFIPPISFVKPFISLGIEGLYVSSKTDLVGDYVTPSNQNISIPYQYWTDGTIRDLPQSANRPSTIIQRDFVYETPIKLKKQNTIGIPVDVGLDFNITNRTSAKIGYTLHYTFANDFSGVTSKQNDIFTFTYFSLNFDLFSDPKWIKKKSYLVELDYNAEDAEVMGGDEDGDMVPDPVDRCLHTPKGVEVDSVGCPFDDDKDGVPNYLDKQPNTPAGAIVDNNGVEISDDLVWNNLNEEALNRKDVESYISIMNNIASGTSRRAGKVEIPAKFKALDADGDGYISFDEVLKAIDSFFDFDSDLTTQDIYELNDFFFSQ